MALIGSQHKQIQDALLAAFTREEFRRVVKHGMDVDFDAHAPDKDYREQVFAFVGWVDRQNRVTELIAAALGANSGNAAVRALALDAMTWPVCAGASDALFVTDAPAPRRVEEAYLADLVQKYAKWLERYTPLAGIAEVQAQAAQPTLVFDDLFMPAGFEKLVEHGFGPDKRIERVVVDDLLDAITKYQRLVVLGEPGSGKTTTLWRLVYDYASAAQQDAQAPIPIFVPLGGYTGPESALAYSARFAGDLGLHLPAYLEKGRAVLLLDALNEMPREGYSERVRRVQAILDRFPAAPVVVTCRALDYVETLKLEKVDVTPLDVFRQRAYLHRYLGEAQGDKLFWQLAGGEAVEDLWAAWQRLGLSFEQMWGGKELPDEVRRFLTAVQQNALKALHKDSLPPLLALGVNPFLLVMFAQVHHSKGALPQNRSKLFAVFADTLLERERQRHTDGWPGANVLKSALAVLAFAMQESGERGTAVLQTWAAKQLRCAGCTADEVLYLGASASLIDTSGDQMRFVHQLLQEYFAAVAWQTRFEHGDDLRRYWPYGWMTPTGWEETAVLLAGMMPDMTDFVEQFVPVNPALAARCIGESGGVRPGEATISKVQTALVAVATSLTAPVTERNAAGNALNYLGDPRRGVGLKDGLPDIAWCKVPAGEFLT